MFPFETVIKYQIQSETFRGLLVSHKNCYKQIQFRNEEAMIFKSKVLYWN